MCLRFGANFLGSGTTGCTWARDLALGKGGAINGQPLAKAGGMVHNIVDALDLVAIALAAGEAVPAKAAALMARPILPLRAYKLIGDLGWLMQARRNRVLTRLRARPFKQVQPS